MQLQEALSLYNLPYIVASVTDTDGSTLYKLIPTGAQATRSRLVSRLQDIQDATGLYLTVENVGGLCLRAEKASKPTYLYMDYAGYTARDDMQLPFMLGLTSSQVLVDDLATAPHLLVAGTTGSGKSNFLHTLINSIGANPAADLHLLDCKMVEFNIYSGLFDVKTDLKGAYLQTAALLQLIQERYKDMMSRGLDRFTEYRKETGAQYHVFIVDELADLINARKDRAELVPRLLRIAQIGRAAGVHMVLATQRPDHTVINGTLKGNIPARIAFNCVSSFDSRVIIDRSGAEKLSGNGDGLYLKNGAQNLERFQACYLPIEDIKEQIKGGI